jgi:hypothetical protein
MWGLKLIQAKSKPERLKLDSALLNEIISMGEIMAGSSGKPFSLLL